MGFRDDDGYVMGLALAALLVLSMTATAIMAIAGSELSSVRAAEREEGERRTLAAAAVLGAASLATDPAQRTLPFESGIAIAQVGDRSVRLSASWESQRLDINQAPLADIALALDRAGLSGDDRELILNDVQARRSRGERLRMVDDVVAALNDPECARRVLTVFGGRSSLTEADASPTSSEIGWPAPGSRLRLTAEIIDADALRAVEQVILITGDPREPAQIMDVRMIRQTPRAECSA